MEIHPQAVTSAAGNFVPLHIGWSARMFERKLRSRPSGMSGFEHRARLDESLSVVTHESV